VPVYFFNGHFISLLQAFYKIKAWNILFITQSVINLFLLLIFVFIFKQGLVGVLISSASALLIVAVLAGANIAKRINIQEVAVDFKLIGDLLRFGFKSHIGNVLKDLNYRGDLFIISYFLSPAMVGFYVVATNVAEIIWKIPDAVGAVLLPKVAQLSKEEAANFTPKVCRIVLLPVFLISFFIIIFSNILVTSIFGIAYKPAVSALILLVPGILALTLWKILANTIIALGYPVQYSLTTAIALMIMILFDFILIPLFGINGAAIASTLAYITATVYIVVIYKRITHNSFRSLLMPQKLDLVFYKAILFS
jgi:O-antigen/teichoic acid export membrane protein